MSNKKSKLGVISAVAAGTGTAIYLAQKAKKESGNSESGNSIFKKSTVADSSVPDNYRNTERGKYDRNSKGIYYSNGNYEAFAHPEKPEGVDQKNAYIVGSGLASLAAACFLVRDAQMPGCQILLVMDKNGENMRLRTCIHIISRQRLQFRKKGTALIQSQTDF